MVFSESNRGECNEAEPEDQEGESNTLIQYACPSCGYRLEQYTPNCPGCGVDLDSLFSGTYRMPGTKAVRTIAMVALVCLGALFLLVVIATIAQWLTSAAGVD